MTRFQEYRFITEYVAAPPHQDARALETAAKNAFSNVRLQRFPKHKVSYKKKKLQNDSLRAGNMSNCIRIENGAISIPKVVLVPIVLHRGLETKNKTVTFQIQTRKFGFSITQEEECKTATQLLEKSSGFDINSKQTVVGSNGFVADNPKFLKQSKEKL
ncbi:transposase, partial [Pseudoalteromonas sp. S1649]